MSEALKKQFKRQGMSDSAATVASMRPKSDELVDMKRTKKDKKKYNELSQPSNGEDYPYGLRIDFDDDMMKKLGMSLPEVGSTVKLVATGTVERAEQRDSGEGQKVSCCVQLKKMKVS